MTTSTTQQRSWLGRKIETNHSIWALLSIQVLGVTSVPAFGASVFIGQAYGFASALIGLLLGNLVLLAIAFAILQMSENTQRTNTLENARYFVGRFGAYLLGLFLLLDTWTQFLYQTSFTSEIAIRLLHLPDQGYGQQFFRFGTILGIISTVIAMPGISGLKRITVWAFPIMGIVFVLAIFHSPHLTITPVAYGNVFRAIVIVIGTGAPVVVDYPTFMRHTRSYGGAKTAVALIQLVTLALSIGGLFLGASLVSSISKGELWLEHDLLLQVSVLILIFGSCVFMNVANVYSASIAWEVVAPFLSSAKEYLIIGLLLALGFPWFAHVVPANALNNTADNSLAVLCVVLVTVYMVKKVKGGVPNRLEIVGYLIAWIGGMIICGLGQLEVLGEYSSLAWGGLFGIVVSGFVASITPSGDAMTP